jgi:hypothetical protein
LYVWFPFRPGEQWEMQDFEEYREQALAVIESLPREALPPRILTYPMKAGAFAKTEH